jgi:hypothetical protein
MVHHDIVCLLLLGNRHCHLPSLVLLSIRCVVGVIVGSLHYLCLGEYYPLPLPCTSGATPM